MIQAIGSPFEVRDSIRRTYLPLLIVAGGVGLLQWHSIQFWQAMTGEVSGVGFSIVLEAISLWLWFRVVPWPTDWRDPRQWFRTAPAVGVRLLAILTTCVLLSGPLYQVSAPLIREGESLSNAAASVEMWKGIVEQAKTNSRDKIGWGSVMLDAARQATTLGAAPDAAKASTNWQRIAVVVLQSFALVIIQWSVVLAIGTLAQEPPRPIARIRIDPPMPKPEPAPEPEPEPEPAAPGIAEPTPDSPNPPWRAPELTPTPESTAPVVRVYRGPANTRPTTETPERRAVEAYRRHHGFEKYSEVARDIQEHKSTLSEFINGRLQGRIHARIHDKLRIPNPAEG